MAKMNKILIIEDDISINKILSYELKNKLVSLGIGIYYIPLKSKKEYKSLGNMAM